MFKFGMIAAVAVSSAASAQSGWEMTTFEMNYDNFPWIYTAHGQVPHEPFNMVITLKDFDCAIEGIEPQVQFLDVEGDGRFDYAATGTVIYNLDYWHETGELLDPNGIPLSISATNLIDVGMYITNIPRYETYHMDGQIPFRFPSDVIVPGNPFDGDFDLRWGGIHREVFEWGNCAPPVCQPNGTCLDYSEPLPWTEEDFRELHDRYYKDDFKIITFNGEGGAAQARPEFFRTSFFVVPQGSIIKVGGECRIKKLGTYNDWEPWIRNVDPNACPTQDGQAKEMYEIYAVVYGPTELSDVFDEYIGPCTANSFAGCAESVLHRARKASRDRLLDRGPMRPIMLPLLMIKCAEAAVAAVHTAISDNPGWVGIKFPCSTKDGWDVQVHFGDEALGFNDTYIFPHNGPAFVWDPQGDGRFNFGPDENGWGENLGGVDITGLHRYTCDSLDELDDEAKAAWEQAICEGMPRSWRRCVGCIDDDLLDEELGIRCGDRDYNDDSLNPLYPPTRGGELISP